GAGLSLLVALSIGALNGLLVVHTKIDSFLITLVAVTTAALVATMLNYNLHLNSWVGAGLSLLVALSIGALNGLLVVHTKIDSFLITL
ncbi:hypothetical protein HT105_24725, partial [Bacteroides fragilis]|nr:hypothetical protein [Bacteroides fragilis]